MPHKQGDKNVKSHKPMGSKDVKHKKQMGSKDDFVVLDKMKIFESMYGKPVEKGSKEHRDMVRGMYEVLFEGNILPDKPPEKYGGADADFSVDEGSNVSFFT